MSYYFSQFVLFRIPVFASDHYRHNLNTALQSTIFKAAIYLASPQFYNRLAKVDFEPSQMTTREILTLTRYLNRACFRPVPFGFFASVTMGKWVASGRITLTDEATELHACVQPGESFLRKLANQHTDINQLTEMFEPNPTLYRVKKFYRFIKEDSGPERPKLFQLQSSPYSQVLRNLLLFCRNGKSKALIIDRICKEAHSSLSDSLEYFEFLKDAQILLSKNRPGISGRHAFSATKTLIGQLPEAADLQALGRQLLMTKDGLLRDDDDLFNTILVRHPECATIDIKYQQDLKEGFKEMENAESKDNLLRSIKKGNAQQITVTQGKEETKYFVSASPQFKTIDLYDDKMKRIKREELLQPSQKTNTTQKQTRQQKEGLPEKKQQSRKRKMTV